MNKTPNNLRLRIGIFGRRNAGKSSLFNKFVRHNAAIVSPEPGTTTDPVKKSMEHHFLGPLLVIDTAGIDDTGSLGEMRREKTQKTMESIDLAIIVLAEEWGEYETQLTTQLQEGKIPIIAALNKTDILPINTAIRDRLNSLKLPFVEISAKTGKGIDELYNEVSRSLPSFWGENKPLVRDLFPKKSLMILVVKTPYTLSSGRLSTAHNRIIRDVLDNDGICIVTDQNEFASLPKKLKIKPALITADFAALQDIIDIVPSKTPIVTSSLVLARFRGYLSQYIKGALTLKGLNEHDEILFIEMEEKAPLSNKKVIENFMEQLNRCIKKQIKYHYTRTDELQKDMNRYKMIVFCNEDKIITKKSFGLIEKTLGLSIPAANIDVLSALIDKRYSQILKAFSTYELDLIS